ncbi:hypothetical protein GCM10027614_17180 [Micromonospora vulcania]
MRNRIAAAVALALLGGCSQAEHRAAPAVPQPAPAASQPPSVSATPSAASRLPGFVVLTDFDPRVHADIRYATAHNFVGRPITAYPEPLCLLTRQAAEALRRVQDAALAGGHSLKVYDCYRPQPRWTTSSPGRSAPVSSRPRPSSIRRWPRVSSSPTATSGRPPHTAAAAPWT